MLQENNNKYKFYYHQLYGILRARHCDYETSVETYYRYVKALSGYKLALTAAFVDYVNNFVDIDYNFDLDKATKFYYIEKELTNQSNVKLSLSGKFYDDRYHVHNAEVDANYDGGAYCIGGNEYYWVSPMIPYNDEG